jgi:hypothetical protein
MPTPVDALMRLLPELDTGVPGRVVGAMRALCDLCDGRASGLCA